MLSSSGTVQTRCGKMLRAEDIVRYSHACGNSEQPQQERRTQGSVALVLAHHRQELAQPVAPLHLREGMPLSKLRL